MISAKVFKTRSEIIDAKFLNIDEKLKDLSLTEKDRQLLLEERAEYEEQSEELDDEE
jgi:hypothetical protein